jgi:hypothetical protein
MGLPEEADGGTRTPDPIITRGSEVSLVGVSGGRFAVKSRDSGLVETGRDKPNAPRTPQGRPLRDRVALVGGQCQRARAIVRAALSAERPWAIVRLLGYPVTTVPVESPDH